MRESEFQWESETHMATIHFKKTTTATPEQFIARLTDFGPGFKHSASETVQRLS